MAAALAAAGKHRSSEVEPLAVAAVIGKSEGRARSLEVAAEQQLRRALEQADVRHRQQQKRAVHAAVTEAIDRRKLSEESTVQAAVSAALEEASQRMITNKMREVREAESRVRQEVRMQRLESGGYPEVASRSAPLHAVARIQGSSRLLTL